MNFFKITLLAVTVAGLACADVSAHNDSLISSKNCHKYNKALTKSGVLSNLIQSGFGALGTMITVPSFLASLDLTVQAAHVTQFCDAAGMWKYLSYDLVINCNNAETILLAGALSSLLFCYLSLKFGKISVKKFCKALDRIEKAIIN